MKYISLEKFCTCSQTYQHYSDQIDPYPWSSESVDAIALLFLHIIDPIIDHFGLGSFHLTYGFCSIDLKRCIQTHKTGRICPAVDQHMAHELTPSGNYYCNRLGAAADFLIKDVKSNALVRHIKHTSLPFDSIYYYGEERPIHISYGHQHKRSIYGFTSAGTPLSLSKHSF